MNDIQGVVYVRPVAEGRGNARVVLDHMSELEVHRTPVICSQLTVRSGIDPGCSESGLQGRIRFLECNRIREVLLVDLPDEWVRPVGELLPFVVFGPSYEEVSFCPRHRSVVDSSLVLFGSGILLRVVELLVDERFFVAPVAPLLEAGHEYRGELEAFRFVYREHADRVDEGRIGMLCLGVMAFREGKHKAEEELDLARSQPNPY